MLLLTQVAAMLDVLSLKGKCGVPPNTSSYEPVIEEKSCLNRMAATVMMRMTVVPGGLLLGNAKGTQSTWRVLLITMGHVERAVMHVEGKFCIHFLHNSEQIDFILFFLVLENITWFIVMCWEFGQLDEESIDRIDLIRNIQLKIWSWKQLRNDHLMLVSVDSTC